MGMAGASGLVWSGLVNVGRPGNCLTHGLVCLFSLYLELLTLLFFWTL